ASVENEVRRNRPEARPEFVSMLSQRVTGVRGASRPRLVAAFAATALLLIALVALGGISYAAGGAGSAASSIKDTFTLSSISSSTNSPASDQYNIGPCNLN